MTDETVVEIEEPMLDEEVLPIRAPTRREKWSILAVAGVAYLILAAMLSVGAGGLSAESVSTSANGARSERGFPDMSTSESTMTTAAFAEVATAIETEISRVMVGQQEIVREVLICIIAGGHALLEGVPGLGKTMLVKTLADSLELEFSRIQFTPDLMPADITGTNILMESDAGERQFAFQPGPIFANLVLADEINRATPKTQSALARSDAGQNRVGGEHDSSAASTVFRAGDAESTRDGRNLSAAGSAARPVLLQADRAVSERTGSG